MDSCGITELRSGWMLDNPPCSCSTVSQALRAPLSSAPTLTPAPDVILREYPGNWSPTECIISYY